MRRTAATVVTGLVAVATLTACSGQSAYCEAVETNTETLNSFGKERTDAAYASYSTTFREVAELAPEAVQEDWTQLAEATDGVIEAQSQVGLALEDMTDEDKVAELGTEQLAQLNEAYEAFNDTSDQRTAVVTNVKQECEITLR